MFALSVISLLLVADMPVRAAWPEAVGYLGFIGNGSDFMIGCC